MGSTRRCAGTWRRYCLRVRRRLENLDGEFTDLFRTFEHTAFRLETLQQYKVEYEEEPLRRFLAGDPMPVDPSKAEWCGLIRDARAQGKRMERVHVVVVPPSDYIRYEMTSYAPNVKAGEDIRIASVGPGEWISGVPRQDFWLFDSNHLWLMTYDADGRFLYAEFVDDPAEIVRANAARDAAMHAGVPFEAFPQSGSGAGSTF